MDGLLSSEDNVDMHLLVFSIFKTYAEFIILFWKLTIPKRQTRDWYKPD
jgi:hypothetical protein